MAENLHSRLSTTALAVLGLLGVRSFTGYELTHQARRTLAHMWPKEESVIYDQPPRLQRLGLVSGTAETAQGRKRTRYRITDAGRRAVRGWLASPPAPPRLEIETALRVFFADQGELADVQRAVAALAEWVEERVRHGGQSMEETAARSTEYTHRLHINVLATRLYVNLYTAIADWTDVAAAELDRWDSTTSPGPRAETEAILARGMADMRALVARFDARAASRSA